MTKEELIKEKKNNISPKTTYLDYNLPLEDAVKKAKSINTKSKVGDKVYIYSYIDNKTAECSWEYAQVFGCDQWCLDCTKPDETCEEMISYEKVLVVEKFIDGNYYPHQALHEGYNKLTQALLKSMSKPMTVKTGKLEDLKDLSSTELKRLRGYIFVDISTRKTYMIDETGPMLIG